MKYDKVNLVYFSATGTTLKVVKAVAKGTGITEIIHFNITKNYEKEILVSQNAITIFGMPVYAGRIPQIAIDSLNRFSSNGSPAIVVCTYGNRDFDDAVLELKNIVEKNNFHVVSAGAFIAQHSIFPQVAKGRPDNSDLASAEELGGKSIETLARYESINTLPQLTVKGNFPYRAITSIPIRPKTNNKCNKCYRCVKECPTGAISENNPHKIDKTKCIACAHCISICDKKAKHFGGLLYKVVSRKFTKRCALPQKPYTSIAGRD
ncbi:MAG: EFR1 family ferrodoxin [Rikenellaceae bacterium]